MMVKKFLLILLLLYPGILCLEVVPPHAKHNYNSSNYSSAIEETHPINQFYLDDRGNICQDVLETVQEVKYENQIFCTVQMQKKCPDSEYEMGQTCHTMFKKECQISYRPQMTKVKVKVCPNENKINVVKGKGREQKSAKNSVVLDIRPTPASSGGKSVSQCVNGVKRICVTKYETECKTIEVKQEMEEDHPRCKVEMMEKCSPAAPPVLQPVTNRFQSSNRNRLPKFDWFKKPVKDECQKYPAMRCRIEKRMVTKMKPETRCDRYPRKFCRKEKCERRKKGGNIHPKEEEEEYCYFRNQVVNEIVPEEKCEFRPKRICHDVRRRRRKKKQLFGDHENDGCQMEPVEKCKNKPVKPRLVSHKMRKTNCRPVEASNPRDKKLVKDLIFQMLAQKLRRQSVTKPPSTVDNTQAKMP